MTQEMASIARAIQAVLPNHNSYYLELPEGYVSPALYFPPPEIETRDSSLDSHDYDFSWFVKFFDDTDEKAWNAGLEVQRLFKTNRNLIPIVNEDGSISDKCFRIQNTTLKRVDFRVVQVYIRWKSIYTLSSGESGSVTNFGVNFV